MTNLNLPELLAKAEAANQGLVRELATARAASVILVGDEEARATYYQLRSERDAALERARSLEGENARLTEEEANWQASCDLAMRGGKSARARAESAEASLAKAVEGLEKIANPSSRLFETSIEIARETLASIRAKREGEEQGASRDHERSIGSALERAIFVAAGAHSGQIDRGGAPYIHHVLRVVRAVERPEDKVVAALHDLLEDCADWTPARLKEEGFSGDVIDAVVALTRGDDEMYDAFIRRVAENDIARRVKLADLADNSDLSRIRTPSRSDQGRIEKYARAISFLSSAKPDERDSSRDEQTTPLPPPPNGLLGDEG